MDTIAKNGAPTLGCDLERKEAEKFFESLIRGALASMEYRLKNMAKVGRLNIQMHRDYVEYCQCILRLVKLNARKITSLPSFFSTASLNYWPPECDPTMFVASTIGHITDWNANKTVGNGNTFLHFLLSGFDQVIKTDKLSEHNEHLKVLMTYTPVFLRFVVNELAKPLFQTSVQTEAGWVLLGAYYPQLAMSLASVIGNDMIEKGNEWCWLLAIRLLATIMREVQGLVAQNSSLFADPRTGTLYLRWDRILAILVLFWQILGPAMDKFAEDDPRQIARITEYHAFFNSLKQLAPEHKPCDGRVIQFPNRMDALPNGTYHVHFVAILKEHVNGWSAPAGSKQITVANKTPLDKNTPAKATIPIPRLREVMHPGEGCCLDRALTGVQYMFSGASYVVGTMLDAIRKPKTEPENPRNDEYEDTGAYGFLRPPHLD